MASSLERSLWAITISHHLARYCQLQPYSIRHLFTAMQSIVCVQLTPELLKRYKKSISSLSIKAACALLVASFKALANSHPKKKSCRQRTWRAKNTAVYLSNYGHPCLRVWVPLQLLWKYQNWQLH